MRSFCRSVMPEGNGPARWTMLLVGLVVGIAGSSLSGCAFYSFSGADIPSHLETIAIPLAEDNTASPLSTPGRDLTSRLTDQFVGRTNLSLDNDETNADVVLRTRILRYTNEPSGVSGDERATTNSVSIDISAQYVDQTRDSTMLDRSFTGSAEYDPSQGIGAEQEAAQLALERVAEDIFTTATSNW